MKKSIYYIAILWTMLAPMALRAEIRTALIVPQSGDYRIWGDELAIGAKTAVDLINKEGGINGQRLTLEIIDDPCSENLSVSTAQMLTLRTPKPTFIIGPYCSSGFAKIADTFAKAQIFQIVPMILSHDNASKNYDGMIKISGVKENSGIDFFNFYNKNHAGKHVAVIYDDNNEDIQKTAQSVSEQFLRHGKISLLHTYTFNQDYNNQETVLLLLGKSKQIINMIDFAKQKNPNVTIITDKYMIGDNLQNFTDKFLQNVYFMGLPLFETNPDFAETIVDLRLKNIELNGLNIYGYMAVQTFAKLAIKAKSTLYDDIALATENALENNFWSNASQNNENTIHYVFYRFENDEFITAEE